MCLHASGVAVKAQPVKVYFLEGNDSHQAIRDHHGIRDDGGVSTSRQTSLEYIPYEMLGDFSTYELQHDGEVPDWWDSECEEEAIRQFQAFLRPSVEANEWKWEGDVDLRHVTSIPEGVTLTAGRNLNLGSLKTIPEGVTLTAGRDFYLYSLETIPEGVTLTVGENLYLYSLETIPEGVTLTAGRNLYLYSLETLPEGVTLTAGRNLYLDSLKTLPEGVTLTAGGDLYLDSLKTLPEGVNVKYKNLYLKSN